MRKKALISLYSITDVVFRRVVDMELTLRPLQNKALFDRRGRPKWLRLRSRYVIRSYEKEVEEQLAHGNVQAAMRALEILSCRYCWHQSVEKLLFYRANRPVDCDLAIDLFKGICDGVCFLSHHRAYARVSLAYLAVKSQNIALARESQSLLCKSAAFLENAPKLFGCQLRNRENHLKRLVSTKTALLHLSLMLERGRSLPAIGLWAHNLLLALDFDQIQADVAFRMISNFCRCLVLYALIDVQAALLDLRRLIVEAGRQRYRWSRASENHLEFVENIVRDLEGGRVPGILTVDSPFLCLTLNEFWRDYASEATTD